MYVCEKFILQVRSDMKLKEFLKKERYSEGEASRAIGKSRTYITQVLRGTIYPSRKTAEAIEKFTKGQVKASDLVNKKKEANLCPVCHRRMPKNLRKKL